MKKLISLFSLLLLVVYILCACEGKKEYVIATDNTFTPFCSVDKDGTAQGFDIDVITLIAKEENIKINIVPAGLLHSLEALENGDADAVIAAVIPTDEWSEKFDFTDSYYKDYSIALKKGENKELLEKLNNGILKLIESGKMNELIENYSLGEDLYE